jgi:PilZ domain
MNERRSQMRQRSFLHGRIYFNNRRSSLDCLVRDYSEQGARLTISDAVAIPEVIELYVPHKDETHRATVQWRTGYELGVSFSPGEASPSIVPDAPDLAGRVRRLETELAALQRKVNELQSELRKQQDSGY